MYLRGAIIKNKKIWKNSLMGGRGQYWKKRPNLNPRKKHKSIKKTKVMFWKKWLKLRCCCAAVLTVLMNAASASLPRNVVQMVMLKNISGQASTFSQILENMMRIMLDTKVNQDGEILPLLIFAAEHPHGHNVVIEMVCQRDCMLMDNARMVEMLNQHEARLEIGTFGCLMIKGQ